MFSSCLFTDVLQLDVWEEEEEEKNSILDQEDPEPPQIKEEEDHCSSQEEEERLVKEEIKSECEELFVVQFEGEAPPLMKKLT